MHVFGPQTPGQSSAPVMILAWLDAGLSRQLGPELVERCSADWARPVPPSVRKRKYMHSGSCAHSSWHAAAEATPSICATLAGSAMAQPTSKQPGEIGVWGRSTSHSPSMAAVCTRVKRVATSPAWHCWKTSA